MTGYRTASSRVANWHRKLRGARAPASRVLIAHDFLRAMLAAEGAPVHQFRDRLTRLAGEMAALADDIERALPQQQKGRRS